MKKIFCPSVFIVMRTSLFVCLFAGFFASAAFASLPAAPKAVVFLPNEVMVQAEQRMTAVRSQQGALQYRIVLPGNVNQKSFYATLDGQRLPFSWVTLPDWQQQKITDPVQETDEARKVLLEAYVRADKEKQELHSVIKGLEQSRVFWKSRAESQAVKEMQPADQLTAIGVAIEKESAAIEMALFEKKKALQNNERAWARAVEELARYDAAHTVVEVAVTAPAEGAATVAYSYILPAIVEASYVVSAEPEAGNVSLVQSVQMRQMSGIDWKDVDVSIAFVSKNYSLRPDDIRPWLLDYQQEPAQLFKNTMNAEEGMARPRVMSKESMMDAQQQAPSIGLGDIMRTEQKEMSSFRLWHLGRRSIANDTPTTVDLASETHEASYFYTLRPGYERRGTLTASLQFEEAYELPQGWANCFVDGIYVGSQRLNINGKEALVYLGSDPQITIDAREVSMQKGEQGVFTKEQTREWHWNYTVNNSRSKAVDVVVETAQPVSQDTSISVTTKSKPEPEKVIPKDERSDPALKLYVWKRTLEPGEIFVIDHKVMVGASVGKELTSKNK